MNPKTIEMTGRIATLTFMAIVTVHAIVFAVDQASRGLPGLPGLLVWAFAAGFGLEFLASAWTGGWRSRRPRRHSLG